MKEYWKAVFLSFMNTLRIERILEEFKIEENLYIELTAYPKWKSGTLSQRTRQKKTKKDENKPLPNAFEHIKHCIYSNCIVYR